MQSAITLWGLVFTATMCHTEDRGAAFIFYRLNFRARTIPS